MRRTRQTRPERRARVPSLTLRSWLTLTAMLLAVLLPAAARAQAPIDATAVSAFEQVRQARILEYLGFEADPQAFEVRPSDVAGTWAVTLAPLQAVDSRLGLTLSQPTLDYQAQALDGGGWRLQWQGLDSRVEDEAGRTFTLTTAEPVVEVYDAQGLPILLRQGGSEMILTGPGDQRLESRIDGIELRMRRAADGSLQVLHTSTERDIRERYLIPFEDGERLVEERTKERTATLVTHGTSAAAVDAMGRANLLLTLRTIDPGPGGADTVALTLEDLWPADVALPRAADLQLSVTGGEIDLVADGTLTAYDAVLDIRLRQADRDDVHDLTLSVSAQTRDLSFVVSVTASGIDIRALAEWIEEAVAYDWAAETLQIDTHVQRLAQIMTAPGSAMQLNHLLIDSPQGFIEAVAGPDPETGRLSATAVIGRTEAMRDWVAQTDWLLDSDRASSDILLQTAISLGEVVQLPDGGLGRAYQLRMDEAGTLRLNGQSITPLLHMLRP